MLLNEEAVKMAGWKVEIVGTDLSLEMVEKAKVGLYNQFEIQRGLPVTYLVKYFQQNGDKWQVNDKLRSMVQFKPMNLLNEWGLGNFDIIFCRNVLIYFDLPTKGKILQKMSDILAPDGALFLGGAETVLGVTDRFKGMDGQHGVYIPAATPITVWKAA
jgi:chemotaxis protein methyltransferase CheR